MPTPKSKALILDLGIILAAHFVHRYFLVPPVLTQLSNTALDSAQAKSGSRNKQSSG